MALLVIEPLESEVMQWLESRHAVRFAPELAREPRALRQALYNVRAIIVPPSCAIDAQALHYAPLLRAVGRVSAGAENIDLDACARSGVEVVRSLTASAQAEAEFIRDDEIEFFLARQRIELKPPRALGDEHLRVGLDQCGLPLAGEQEGKLPL